MSIGSDLIRGCTDTIILSALEKGDSYGYLINKDIRRVSEGEFEFKEATLYSAFRRLEELGKIKSYWGDEDSGARRRYYSITHSGKAELERLRSEWRTAKAALDLLIEREG